MPSHGRVVAVIAVQLAILAAVPARQVRARVSGTPITLRTAPVDPFDAFAGHYVTLSYEVEERRPLAAFDASLQDRDEVWLTVARGDPAWSFVSVTRHRPAGAPGQVSLRARFRSWGDHGSIAVEGAGRFYVTEGQGAAVDAARRGREPALVDLRVGADGTPALVGMRVAGMSLRDR